MDANKALLICLLLLPAIASAHGGRTNAAGCHKDNKHGGSTYQNQSTQTSNNTEPTTSAAPRTLTPQPANSPVREANLAAYKDLVLKIQSALNQLGYVAGQADGVLGDQTIKAIKHFKVANEMVVDAKPSYLLLEILFGKVG